MNFAHRLFYKSLRQGDLVQIRPFGEIAQTLDENGQLDHLPFMPEMIKYCGQQFRVSRRANSVCVDGNGLRGLNSTVILSAIFSYFGFLHC